MMKKMNMRGIALSAVLFAGLMPAGAAATGSHTAMKPVKVVSGVVKMVAGVLCAIATLNCSQMPV